MASLLRIAAVVTCGFVIVGFIAFATDQAQRGSAAQVRSIDPVTAEKAREKKSGPVRELVDDVNDVLLAPFDGVTDSRDPWAQHLVRGALGLVLYGLGLMLLANYLPRSKRRRVDRDWRTA